MGKIGKLIIWFIFAIGLKICKSSVFQINKNSTLYSNDTRSGDFSWNETSFLETFHNSSAGGSVVWTETPKHHKVKRSILVYKQKTLKIQVPDAPLYINSGHEGVGGEHGMPISLMLKSPEHSLKTLPYLIKALKENSQHPTDDEKHPEHNETHHHNSITVNPPVTVNHDKGSLSVPTKHHTHDQHPEVYPEFNGMHQSVKPVERDSQGGPDWAKIKPPEPYHHPKHPVPAEGQFPNYPPDEYSQHRQNEPVPPSHHYQMYPPHNGMNVPPAEKRGIENQQSFMDRVGPERIPPGVEEPLSAGSQWHGASPKEFDAIKKETSNIISKKLIENKLAMPLKQNLEKRDENANLIPEALEEPKLDSIQDLANGAMNFQSIKFVKNSWILPPVNKRNPPTSMENGDYRQNPYNNGLSAPPHTNSFNNNPGYEPKTADSRNNKPNPVPNTSHGGTGDRYVLTGTEEPEMSFDDKGNLLFLKKQTLEILVPKFLMNYTQERTTTPAHYEPYQQYPENYQTNPTGNPANKMSRVNMKYITQNERDKEYFMRRYLKKRRANRDIKATFWHNRGLEDQLLPKTSSPTERQS